MANSDETAQKAILQYLQANGFGLAAQEMEAECRRKAGQPVFQPAQAATLWAGLDAHPARIAELYSKLQQFIAGSLETYKPELSSLSFPVFVHCYLELVRKNNVEVARQMMATWGAEHSLHYEEEVNIISQSNCAIITTSVATLCLELYHVGILSCRTVSCRHLIMQRFHLKEQSFGSLAA
jgi:WD40 associated region in TFIID subunit, NTD2 domain